MRCRWRAVIIAGLVSCARVGVAEAQADASSISIDLGAARLRQSAVPESGVLTFGIDGRITRGGFSLNGQAVGASAVGGGGTAQGSAVASYLGGSRGPSRIELAALTTAFAAEGQSPVSSAQAYVRHHLAATSVGAFYGIAGGRSFWAGESLPVGVVQAGGWWSNGRDQLSAVTALTLTQSEYRTATASGLVRTVYDVRYADAGLAWRRGGVFDRMSLAVSGGSRFGIEGVETSSPWGIAVATVPVGSLASIIAALGEAPEDLVRGVPKARFASVALRLTVGSPAALAVGQHVGGSRAGSLTINRDGGGHVIRVRAPGAARVEVMGDFTEWEPVSLDRAGDDWSYSRALTGGIHQVRVRIDGGAWFVPPNLTRGRDDFGGFVGLITVF